MSARFQMLDERILTIFLHNLALFLRSAVLRKFGVLGSRVSFLVCPQKLLQVSGAARRLVRLINVQHFCEHVQLRL